MSGSIVRSGKNPSNTKRRRAIVMAAAAAAASCGLHAQAQTYSTSTSKVSLVEGTTPATSDIYVGTTRVAVEGENGGTSYEDFAVLDFNASALNLPDYTSITGLNSDSMTLDLIDRSPLDNFAVSGQVNFFLATNTGSLTGDYFMGSGGNNAVGTQLGGIYSLGNVNYVAGTASGRDDTISLNFSSNQASYILSQLQNGGDIRILATPDSATVEANWEGSGGSTSPALAPPKLSFNLQTSALASTDAFLQVGTAGASLSTASKEVDVPTIDRLYVSGTTATTITLSNSGTSSGTFRLISQNGAAGNLGTNTTMVGGGGSMNISAVLTNTFSAGSISQFAPGTASLSIHDSTNPGDTSDATVNFTVNHSITARFVDNQGETATPLNFGNVLLGATATGTVTLDTENTGVPNVGSNTLTIVSLPGTFAISGTNGNIFQTASNRGQLSMAADPAGSNGTVTFITGAESETRNVTFTPLNVGGSYAAHGTMAGFVSFAGLQYADPTLIGAPAKPTAERINLTGNFYQPASLSTAGSLGTLTLANASATANIIGTGTNATNVGLRAAAQIVSTNQVGQDGFVVTGFPTDGTGTIAAGTSLTATATFTADPTPLNGTYTSSFSLGMQHADQTILGTHANDLPTKTFALSANVTGFSGTGSANILAGGTYGGYYINRGSGANTTVSFLGGSASANTTLAVSAWNDAGAAAFSDRSTVTGTAADAYVVQMSYDPNAATSLASVTSLALGYNNGSQFVSPTNAGTGSTAVEINGPYNGNLVVGHYGLNTNTATVWAVVNSPGQFAVVSRTPGDVNFDGVVNVLDFGVLSANFGRSGMTWSGGDFNGDGTVNILDFGQFSANFGGTSASSVAMGGASVNTLTGAKASSSASTVKPAATPAGSGVSVVVNTTTGDVHLSFNNIQSRGYEIDSPSSEMNTFDQFDTPPGPAMLLSDGNIPANDNRGNKYWIVLSSDGDPTRLAEGLSTGYHFSTLPTINQTFDLGDIYVGPSGTNVPDLSVLYVDGLGNGFQQVVQYVGVPEPTTLGLMGLAAAGLVARRRKAGSGGN